MGVVFLVVIVGLERSLDENGLYRGTLALKSKGDIEKACMTSADAQPWMDPSSSLNFDHPTVRARDNLREDTFYVTGFSQGGFTNQFIAYLHLIYLAQLSGRVPILPAIVPAAHVPETAGILPFGSIFNLTGLRAALRHPILEWTDVKYQPPHTNTTTPLTASNPALEHFGCWATARPAYTHANPVANHENLLNIDMSFTRVPKFVFFDSYPNQGDWHPTFYGLSATIAPGATHREAELENVQVMQKSTLGMELKPDKHLSCFDLLFYSTTGVQEFEYLEKWSPAWTHIGRHLRFTDEMQRMAERYVKKGLGLEEGEDIPKMITVHIRRGDFSDMCKDGRKSPCYLPLEAYQTAIEEVRAGILQKHGFNVTRVLVSSNEKDPRFWKTLRERYNWSYLNHTALRTLEDHGGRQWYPLLVDKIALSMGLGFVGTSPSTFSVYNARRVEDWNRGVTKMVSVL